MIKIGGFGKIWRIYSPVGSSTRLGEADCRSVPPSTEILQIGTNRTNKTNNYFQTSNFKTQSFNFSISI